MYFYEPPVVFDVKTGQDEQGSPEIRISFTPREFGREYVAVLIVETEESQWIHEVHGTHPPYVPPDKSQMKERWPRAQEGAVAREVAEEEGHAQREGHAEEGLARSAHA